MKKDYVSPCMEFFYTEIRENLLESSPVDIGGTTDDFNAPGLGFSEIWEEPVKE